MVYGFFPNRNLVGFDALWVVAGLLFIPYLVWGVYLLRHHLDEHIEVRPSIQVGTLIAVVVFFSLQYLLLKTWLGPTPWKLMLAVAGLVISAVALYGHLIISLGSHLLVDMVFPTGGLDMREPRYGAAEACERMGDFEGAVREYTAIARMFPKDPTSVLRAADNLVKLGKEEDSLPYFEQGLDLLDSPESCLPVANRIVEIYIRALHQPEQAEAVLESFLRRFPDSERAESVRNRLAQMRNGAGAVNRQTPVPPWAESE